MNFPRLKLGSLALLLALTACGRETPQPTSALPAPVVIISTPTPPPTATNIPATNTNTPVPTLPATSTPEPSATPVPSRLIQALAYTEVIGYTSDQTPSFNCRCDSKISFVDLTGIASNLIDYRLPELKDFTYGIGQFIASPDGKQAVFTAGTKDGGGLFVLDLIKHHVSAIPSDAGDVSYATNYEVAGFPVWSPDGQSLFFSANHATNKIDNRNIYQWQISQAKLTPVKDVTEISESLNKAVMDMTPAVSPDGNYLAFTRYVGNSGFNPTNYQGALYIRNLSNDMESLIAPSTYIATSFYELRGKSTPAWSPDGQWIAYIAGDKIPKISIVNIRTGEVHWLTTDSASEANPVWSPDGQWIAYTSDLEGNPDIYKISLDGSAEFNLTHNPAADYWPLWSPNGAFIVFGSDRDGNAPGFRLYKIDSDGANTQALETGYGLGPATWVNLLVPSIDPVSSLSAPLAPSDTWATYTDPANGFSFEYPDNWFVVPEGSGNPHPIAIQNTAPTAVNVKGSENPDPETIKIILLPRDNLSPFPSLTAYLADPLRNPNGPQNVTLLKSETTPNGYQTIWRHNQLTSLFLEAYLTNGQQVFRFSASATSQYISVLDHLVNTFLIH